jgi:hypothetical protein
MTEFPAIPLSAGPAGTLASDAVVWFNDLRAATLQLPGARGAQEVQIASGSITPDRALVVVDTVGGSSASSNLSTINVANMPTGSVLVLSSKDASRTVVVQHGTAGAGHIFLADGANLSLTHPSMALMLRRSGDRLHEIGRFYGPQLAAARAFLGLGNAATLNLATQAQAESGVGDDLLTTVARVENMLNHASRMITNKPDAVFLEAAHSLLIAQAGVLREVTMQSLKRWINEPDWTSGNIVYANRIEVAHPLNIMPSHMAVHLVCIQTDLGYPAGYRLKLRTSDTSSSDKTVTTGFDGFRVTAMFPAGLEVWNFDGSARTSINTLRWNVEFHLWL